MAQVDRKEAARMSRAGSASIPIVQQPAAPQKENYEIVSKLGEGGFGACYLVTHKKDKKEYVMKIIKCNNQLEVIESYKEMVMLRICKHPFCIGWHECFKDGFNVVLVMEYAEEGDVQSKLIKAADAAEYLKEERILRWFTQITLALANIHKMSFMHRDIKPGNVFLSRWDVVKMGDFGLATLLGRKPDDKVVKGLAGTPGFMAPELLRGDAYAAKADIWALGCTLYEMCTLRSAYRDTEKKVFPVPLPECYSVELSDLLKRLLTADPAARPTAAELLAIPIVASRVDQVKREAELLAQVDALEERLEYTPMAARLRKANSNMGLAAAGGAASIGKGAAASQAGLHPTTAAQQFAMIAAEPVAWAATGANLLGEAGSWVYGVLTSPERLEERRAILSADEAHVTNLRVCNVILWLPLLTALLGLVAGTLLVLLSQFTRIFVLGLACPAFTYIVCSVLFPLDGAGAPASELPAATPVGSPRPASVAAPKRPNVSVAGAGDRKSVDAGAALPRESEVMLVAPAVKGPKTPLQTLMAVLSVIPSSQVRVVSEAGAFALAYLITDNIPIEASGGAAGTLVLALLLIFSSTTAYIPLTLLLGSDRDGLWSIISSLSLSAGAGTALGFAVTPPKLLSPENVTVVVSILSLHAVAHIAFAKVPALSGNSLAHFFRPSALAVVVACVDFVLFPAVTAAALAIPFSVRALALAWCFAVTAFVYAHSVRVPALVPRWVFTPLFAASLALTLVFSASTAALAQP